MGDRSQRDARPGAPKLNVSSNGKDPPVTVEPREKPNQVVDLRDALVVPPVHRLMTDSQAILGNELTRLLQRSKSSNGLGHKETLQFSRYVRALTDLSKEERAQAGLDDIDKLTDDELIALLLADEQILQRVRRVLAEASEDE